MHVCLSIIIINIGGHVNTRDNLLLEDCEYQRKTNPKSEMTHWRPTKSMPTVGRHR